MSRAVAVAAAASGAKGQGRLSSRGRWSGRLQCVLVTVLPVCLVGGLHFKSFFHCLPPCVCLCLCGPADLLLMGFACCCLIGGVLVSVFLFAGLFGFFLFVYVLVCLVDVCFLVIGLCLLVLGEVCV